MTGSQNLQDAVPFPPVQRQVTAFSPKESVLRDGQLGLEVLSRLASKPKLFEPSQTSIWTDAYVSTQMLAAHTDPAVDAASRRPETIDAEITWLVSRLGLHPDDRILDLGCGPGLYCTRLARMGLDVTGVDYSQTSIAYARESARERERPITYHVQDYLTLEDRDAFRAVLLIYGDFCVLPDEQRDSLLHRIHRALRPGGFFVFDVMTLAAFEQEQPGTGWEVREQGFWRPTPHLVLEEQFTYPDDDVSLHQYGIVDQRGELTVYRVWSQYYDPDTLTPLLEQHGFHVEEMTSDLTGKPYAPGSEWLGIVARRV